MLKTFKSIEKNVLGLRLVLLNITIIELQNERLPNHFL